MRVGTTWLPLLLTVCLLTGCEDLDSSGGKSSQPRAKAGQGHGSGAHGSGGCTDIPEIGDVVGDCPATDPYAAYVVERHRE